MASGDYEKYAGNYFFPRIKLIGSDEIIAREISGSLTITLIYRPIRPTNPIVLCHQWRWDKYPIGFFSFPLEQMDRAVKHFYETNRAYLTERSGHRPIVLGEINEMEIV